MALCGGPSSVRAHICSKFQEGKNLKMVLCPTYSFLTAPVFCFFFTSTTMAEPVEKVDIEALGRTSASAISYGITQQGFAVLGQTNSFLVFLYFLSVFFENILLGHILKPQPAKVCDPSLFLAQNWLCALLRGGIYWFVHPWQPRDFPKPERFPDISLLSAVGKFNT